MSALAGESTKKPRTFTIDPAMHSSCTTETSSGKLTVKVYIERASSKEMMQTKLKTLKGVVTNTISSSSATRSATPGSDATRRRTTAGA